MSTIHGEADPTLEVDTLNGSDPSEPKRELSNAGALAGNDESDLPGRETPSVSRGKPPALSADNPEVFLRGLYERYSRNLLSFVLRINGGDWQWAEDVVQETMLRAWKHTSSLQQSDSPNLMPWLTTVARRIVLNDHRSRRTRPTEVGDAPLSLVTVQDNTERTIQHTILKDALAQLTPAQRRAIVEKYYWSRTGEEVAQTMGVPIGTIKSRIHYALRILRTVLSDRGVTF